MLVVDGSMKEYPPALYCSFVHAVFPQFGRGRLPADRHAAPASKVADRCNAALGELRESCQGMPAAQPPPFVDPEMARLAEWPDLDAAAGPAFASGKRRCTAHRPE